MANRFVNPFPQFFDSTPDVYSSGTLEFYQSGTSTALAVYSDDDLSVSLGTTVTLNSAGRPSTNIFLQDQDYKVILKNAAGTEIWSADPVKGRDSQLIVKTVTGSGSPNGSVAGTAGSSGVLPDFYWDYTNSILYICTTTGTSSTAVWTAINASSATAAVPPPQGRLTPTSNTPVISSGVTAGTAVYYTPYIGNLIPIYNGSSMIPTEFSELTLTLVASHTAGSIYDVFVFSNAGVVTIVTGPGWGTVTAGSGARGTGAGTTELTRIKGYWVNAVSMTGRNGSTTYSIDANKATYVGSIYMDGSNGQISCLTAYGQSRKWSVWNAYNRKRVILAAGDSTASWNYATATYRAANNASANSITVFCGLPEESVRIVTNQRAVISGGGSATVYGLKSGIGWNSTSAISGRSGQSSVTSGSTIDAHFMAGADYDAAPFIGINVATMLESAFGATMAFQGGEEDCRMTAEWLA